MRNQIRSLVLLGSLGLASATSTPSPHPGDIDSLCPGYNARNVKENSHGFVADLSLAGKACNIYGTDLKGLRLEVTYDTSVLPSPWPRLQSRAADGEVLTDAAS